MFEMLAYGTGLASEIVSRTASTARVQGMVQLSLAPAFLLAAIGAFLNVMNGRLIWLTDRVDRLDECEEMHRPDPALEELPVLRRRRTFAHRAINLSTAAALVICSVIAMMFMSALVRPNLGPYVAAAWILAMALVFAGLLFFLLETRLATSSSSERKRISRKIRTKEAADDEH